MKTAAFTVAFALVMGVLAAPAIEQDEASLAAQCCLAGKLECDSFCAAFPCCQPEPEPPQPQPQPQPRPRPPYRQPYVPPQPPPSDY
ncbi:hypothetical protein XA68_13981 [Ophiocordyceps unilateralis]|uniref:Uncharacterized protein n=1 Tax=Ophiocordyceps unilateralis TaxID=268505 RepID=A0A2A9PAC3_OPHUN|nr:hypothetical protein XA68_13981 [Ophiocordyceps unilateralis]